MWYNFNWGLIVRYLQELLPPSSEQLRKVSRFCQTGCYEVDWWRRRIENDNGEKRMKWEFISGSHRRNHMYIWSLYCACSSYLLTVQVGFYFLCQMLVPLSFLRLTQFAGQRIIFWNLWSQDVQNTQESWSFPFACHHDVWGKGGIPPLILNVGTRCRWVGNFTPWLLHSRGKCPQ